jgi:hypothetical protein
VQLDHRQAPSCFSAERAASLILFRFHALEATLALALPDDLVALRPVPFFLGSVAMGRRASNEPAWRERHERGSQHPGSKCRWHPRIMRCSGLGLAFGAKLRRSDGIQERSMRKVASASKTSRRGNGRRVARLYHFETSTVRQIEFLGLIFGGKEKGIAAAVDIAASVLKGEQPDLRISLK